MKQHAVSVLVLLNIVGFQKVQQFLNTLQNLMISMKIYLHYFRNNLNPQKRINLKLNDKILTNNVQPLRSTYYFQRTDIEAIYISVNNLPLNAQVKHKNVTIL